MHKSLNTGETKECLKISDFMNFEEAVYCTSIVSNIPTKFGGYFNQWSISPTFYERNFAHTLAPKKFKPKM
jgi:hypothetical protein